jgi:hypothetical protein
MVYVLAGYETPEIGVAGDNALQLFDVKNGRTAEGLGENGLAVFSGENRRPLLNADIDCVGG